MREYRMCYVKNDVVNPVQSAIPAVNVVPA